MLGLDSIEKLLTHKQLEPLAQEQINRLRKVQGMDVTGFTEADVRAVIIDPIIEALGYEKGEFSSVDREKHIRFRGKKHRYIDYTCTLWAENFWLMEAKKPLHGKDEFGYKELSQATEYSIHPEINASVIALCDGIKFELYDRESSLEKPILSFLISDLLNNFDDLRALLSPIQIWFFYKRRVIKAIDKAFQHEVNINRVDEFRYLVESSLNGKRSDVLKNFQSLRFDHVGDGVNRINSVSWNEIIDIDFFYTDTIQNTQLKVTKLVEECLSSSSFPVVYKLFPDTPRDVNDLFYMNALKFMLEAEKNSVKFGWLPTWLVPSGNRKNSREAIKRLISLCLSYFEQQEDVKTVLLVAATFRRILKLLSIVEPSQQQRAQLGHLFTRFTSPELSWGQIVSSAERNLVLELDRNTIIATSAFVLELTDKTNGSFKMQLAKQNLKMLWNVEINLLESVKNRKELLDELGDGELHPTEAACTVYDNLGHSCLCILRKSTEWKRYILDNHLDEIKKLNSLGSWAARQLLEEEGFKGDDKIDVNLSERFFFGEHEIAKAIRVGYGFTTN
ncbi:MULTISPECIES: type I restriction enzyme HsdR N-terminal domain-containing protein [Vibrio harveyi group]|uniref:type I restriction enzyme HsdR N-terminal domain-containing protein n=1 Tax=Vibrio harveyi group TaxID=717610 RepID=UPI002658B54F|nr:type I restriction enzyme HsdR N-terminal domain-containing protein [Vibrio antiquarius]MCR9967193.1 type I restriction enzyme HsdR N-terminal domain-containing protein [Vibrio antiquarius]